MRAGRIITCDDGARSTPTVSEGEQGWGTVDRKASQKSAAEAPALIRHGRRRFRRGRLTPCYFPLIGFA
jgi:hypothetical protein